MVTPALSRTEKGSGDPSPAGSVSQAIHTGANIPASVARIILNAESAIALVSNVEWLPGRSAR